MAYKREVYEYVEGVYRDRQKQNESDLEKYMSDDIKPIE